MNDWKPGTLAVITGVDGSVLAFRQERQWATLDHLYFSDWQLSDVRPLVVIDAEDNAAVTRLIGLLHDHGYQYNPDADDVDLSAALREFAAPKPPRPDEPQGLGAVVEDEEGDDWHRTRDGRWIAADGLRTRAAGWPGIDVVRVLSEGVRP